MKRYSTSLLIKEMYVKTIVRYNSIRREYIIMWLGDGMIEIQLLLVRV